MKRHRLIFTALAALAVSFANAQEIWVTGNNGNIPKIIEKLNSAHQATEEGRLRDALNIYEDITEDYAGSPLAAEAYFRSGVIYLKRAQFEKAFKRQNELIRRHPEFKNFDGVIAEQYAIATAVKDGQRPYLGGWMPWFKDYIMGMNFFETINYNAPYGYYADLALYDKGTLALARGEKDTAIDSFARIVNNYPASRIAPDAYLALADTVASNVMGPEWDQGSTVDALNYYNDFIALYPENPEAEKTLAKIDKMHETLAKSRLELGIFYYQDRNNPRAAAIFFNEAINAAPESDTAKEAEKFLADIRAGKKAKRTLADYIFGRYPEHADGDFIDAPAQPKLEDMGFTTKDTGTRKNTPAFKQDKF